MIIQNDPRRWKERADGSMVMEDRSAAANLSPNVMIRAIPHHDIPVDPSMGHRPIIDSMHIAFLETVKGK